MTAARVWNLPLRAHLAGLVVLLLVLLPLVGTGASFSADEGAAIVQAQSLSRGEGWIVDHPMPEVDPVGDNYPLENSERGANGRAPFAKHPLYAVMLAGADRTAGVTGMVALSLVGTVMAAGLAALVGRRLDEGLARPALWAVGLGSPLLFDGLLVMGHALAAAAAAGAVVLILRAQDKRSVLAAIALVPVIALGMLLRSEFLLFAVAAAAVTSVVGLITHRVAISVLLAAETLTAAVAARAMEHSWTSAIVGAPTGPGAQTLSSGGPGGRLRGFVLTWLTQGYGRMRPAYLALMVMLFAVVVGACVVRRGLPGAARAVVLLSVVGAGGAVSGLALRPANVIPGLLVAFPLAAAGLILVRRETLKAPTVQLCLGTFALFALAVAATQYERGGSGEWGGRYFALGVPVLVPVLLLAIRDGGRALSADARRCAATCLVICTAALSTMSIVALRAAHEGNAAANEAVTELAATVGMGTGDRPVIVAADGALARLGWPSFDEGRWLLAGGDLAGLASRLAAAGVSRFVYVGHAGVETVPNLSVVDRRSGRGWSVLQLST